jgi:hypothetical protein
MDKIEEPVNHLYFLIENQSLLNSVLGPLILKENPETDDEKNPIFSFHFFLPAKEIEYRAKRSVSQGFSPDSSALKG